MLMLLSPAKTLDYESVYPSVHYTQPDYLSESQFLIDILKQYAPSDIAQLMHISDPLAVQNSGRFYAWTPPFTEKNSRPAIFAFKGDVYKGLDAYHLPIEALEYAQQHMRILSGLYGLLRPLDLIQAYRLEMGTKLKNAQGNDLYAFWGNKLSQAINGLLGNKNAILVNLASEEYSKAAKLKLIRERVVTPVFEDYKNGQYKVINFYVKRARGLMARFAMLHRITQVHTLKEFDCEGYQFVPAASSDTKWVFRRNPETRLG